MQQDDKSVLFTELYGVIQRLRGPDGCPWDQKQTPVSIKKYLLEETRELADAISSGDREHVREEIGDLFFILILIARMYEEEGHFTIGEALSGIISKMIRRHPHVFSDAETGNDAELKAQWNAIKQHEKKGKRNK